jgi:conjugative relaxase-like TrwC/TraI family protein
VIRSYAVKVPVAASYNEYLQRQVDHYQRYVQGEADGIGKDMEVAERPTRVIGEAQAAGAIGLRLGESPSEEAITRVSCGCHAASGDALVRGGGADNPTRTAYQDLVFSVPKSVSVEFAAARAAGDETRAQQLITVMTESVEAAVAHIQELVPLGRRRVGPEGIQVSVPTRIAGLLDVHSAARPVRGQTSGDPHLHTHCRILNLGLQEDGRVASVNYWMLYQNIRALNALFECGMRSRLEQLGYATVDASHGDRREWASFELARENEALSQALSARTEHVQHLAQLEWEQRQQGLLATLQLASALRGAIGLPPGEPVTELTTAQREACRPTPAQVAALSRASREQKLAESHAALAEEWGRVCAAHGYRHQPSDASPAEPPLRPSPDVRAQTIQDIVVQALAPPPANGLVASRSVFDRADILEHVAAPCVRGRLDEAELRRSIAAIEAGAVRLPVTVHEPMGAFTTEAQMRLEREAVTVAVEMACDAPVSVPDEAVTAAMAAEEFSGGHALDTEQTAAVRAFCGPSGWVQLVGVAGSGKTTVCRPTVAALQKAGYQVLGVSLSQAATDVLAGETGIPAWNLADFTTRVEHNLLRTADGRPVSMGPNTVLLVDEAGTVDSRMWHAFTRQCRDWGVAGVRILGDPEQTQPVGSGSILGWLSRHLPTTHLTANYRQGLGGHEAECARMLRDGRGTDFLRLKDRMGQLWIDATPEVSVERAAGAWARAIAEGGDPRQHVLLSDLVDVTRQLNQQARAEYDRLGHLSVERVEVGGREWAVGERVVFTEQHRGREILRDDRGNVELRRDGTPRTRRLRTPRRTQGELVGMERTEAGGLTLRVQTDSRGRLPSRVVEIPETEVGPTLDHGYAMTTTVAQGRTWDATYRVLTASRLTGRQQEYPAATRHVSRSFLFGDLRSVAADPEGAVSVRDDAMEKYGALISRDVAKFSTLDYLSPSDRAELEKRLTPLYLRTPSAVLNAPMTDRQAAHLSDLGREPQPGWSWVRASVEIDVARGKPAGQMALGWLTGQGVRAERAWEAVDGACRQAGVTSAAARPSPTAPPIAPLWDGASLVDQLRAERRTTLAAPRATGLERASGDEATPDRHAAIDTSSGRAPRQARRKDNDTRRAQEAERQRLLEEERVLQQPQRDLGVEIGLGH